MILVGPGETGLASPPSYTLGSSFIERFANAQDGVVWRIDPRVTPNCDPARVSSDAAIRCHAVRSGSPIPNRFWSTHLATLLTDLGSFHEASAPTDFSPVIAISYGGAGTQTDMLIDPLRPSVEIHSAGLPTVFGVLTDPSMELAQMIGEAAAKRDPAVDSLVTEAKLRLRARVEGSDPIGPFWPDCSEPPDPGSFSTYDEEAVPIDRPAPEYPSGGTSEARVATSIFVDPDGRVCAVKIIYGRSPFAEAVVEAVRRWTFHPARDHGTPVGVWVEVPFDFTFTTPAPGQAASVIVPHEPPRVIARTKPIYPEFAREAQITGTVVLTVQVDARGTITGVKVTRGVTGLNEAAVDAVKHWKFQPATVNGEPVVEAFDVSVEFP